MDINIDSMENFQKVIELFLKRADMILINQEYDTLGKDHKKIRNVIFSLNKNYKKELIENYSDELVEEIAKKYKNNSKLWKICECDLFLEQTGYQDTIDYMMDYVEDEIIRSLKWFVYENTFNDIQQTCDEFYELIENYAWTSEELKINKKHHNQAKYRKTRHWIQLNGKSRDLILKNCSRWFDYYLPVRISSIGLFKKNICIFHNEYDSCYIDYKDNKEYQYLETLGDIFEFDENDEEYQRLQLLGMADDWNYAEKVRKNKLHTRANVDNYL